MTTDRPRMPTGLGPAGRSLWRGITAAYILAEHEIAILAMACHQADDVARLEEVIATDGITVRGSAGQPRLNAAVTEVRQGRLALGKLLGQIGLPNEGDRPMTAAAMQAQKAANFRWERKRLERERRAARVSGDGA